MLYGHNVTLILTRRYTGDACASLAMEALAPASTITASVSPMLACGGYGSASTDS